MEKNNYLNVAKADDIQEKKNRILYRLLEVLPGVISIATLIGVVLFSWLLPQWVAIFIICFSFYYLLRIIYFSIHQIIGYFRVRKSMSIGWLGLLRKTKREQWKGIYHLVILPTYQEDPRIIRESIHSLLAANYPKEKIIVALAVEERAGQRFFQEAKKIETEYASRFFAFLTVVHPANIPGEVSGKGSNVAYAGKIAREKIIAPMHIPLGHVLVSTFDIDTKVYPDYFACLTYHYLTERNPLRASYQPVPVYNNNIWRASFFARVVSTSNTFWQMIQQERSEKMATYSSHAIPGPVFYEVGYPTNVVSDDSRMFWKAYLHYDGDYRVVPLYYLVSMDAVDSPNLFHTIANQYKQQKRWAWGVVEIPYILFGFIKNRQIPFINKISHLYTIIDGYWSWATAALLLFLLGWLPVLLGGQKFDITVLSFNLPILTSRIMTISLVGVLLSAILSTMLLPKLPRDVSVIKKIAVFLQWLLLPIILIVFGSIPALDAQIQLMMGRYLGFWVTEKVR